MLAAFYVKQGPARDVLVLGDLNKPMPGAGQVRVAMRASGINPADVKRRAGATARPMVWPIVIPHSDGAGVVDAVGRGVRNLREGDRVWLWNAQWSQPFGTAAQFTTLPAEQAVPLPDNVSFEIGASLGVPGLTAHRCISVLEPLAGRRVLVFGAAGGIGNLVVQLAKAQGAHVTAVVSSTQKASCAIDAGADDTKIYTAPNYREDIIAAAGLAGFDAIVEVDFGMNGADYPALLARQGSAVIFGSASNMRPQIDVYTLQKHGVSLHLIAGAELPAHLRAAALDEITDRVSRGQLRPRLQASFPLKEIVASHEMVEAGSLSGKVVLTIEHDL